MEPILKIENLKTSFMTSNGEVQAVRGVSFTVGKGEILGLVGESGSGKALPPCLYCGFWRIRPELKKEPLPSKGRI